MSGDYPLPVYFDALDAGMVDYADALRRRLAACKRGHQLVEKRKKPPVNRAGKPRWFNWSGREISPFANQGAFPGPKKDDGQGEPGT